MANMVVATMSSGHQSPPANKRTEQSISDAVCSGRLDLSNLMLDEYPKSASRYELSDTVEADISRNRLIELPHELSQYTLLERLDLYHNSIKSLPESISQLGYLTYLNLSRNQLSHLPAHISKLECLEVLHASHNRLVSIPEEISDMLSLMELNVSCNVISALPVSLGSVPNLKILNLHRNSLVALPAELSKLRLKTLDFSANRVQAIPVEFKAMESLEILILDNNPLITPPAHVCQKGRVHIMKFLSNLALKEERRRGVTENGFTRGALRRSYNRDEPDALRIRRREIISVDSGYGADALSHRWSNNHPAAVNALNAEPVSIDSVRDRHAELSRRIISAELHSPQQNVLPSSSTTSTAQGTDGSISPLRVGPAKVADTSEDMFTRELQKQKHEYEMKKKKAEQIRSEGMARKSHSQLTPPTSQASSSKEPPTDKSKITGNQQDRPLLYSERPNSLQLSMARQNSLTAASSSTERSDTTPTPSSSASSRTSLDKVAAAVNPTDPRKPARRAREAVSGLVGKKGFSSNSKVDGKPASQSAHSSVAGGAAKGTSSSSLCKLRTELTPGQLGSDVQIIQDLREILESRLKMPMPEDLATELKDGVVLCHLVNHIKPRTVSQIHVKSPAVPKLTMAKSKRNVENFLEACKQLGVAEGKLCSPSQILDDKNIAAIHQTVLALIELKRSASQRPPALRSSPTPRVSGSRKASPLQSFV